MSGSAEDRFLSNEQTTWVRPSSGVKVQSLSSTDPSVRPPPGLTRREVSFVVPIPDTRLAPGTDSLGVLGLEDCFLYVRVSVTNLPGGGSVALFDPFPQ